MRSFLLFLALTIVPLVTPEAAEIQCKPKGPVITNITKLMPKGVSGVSIEGKYLYVGGKGVITVLDISKPKEPREIGSVNFPGTARQLVPYNGKLFVSARETGVWIFDISNPAAPSIITRYDGIELSTGLCPWDFPGKNTAVGCHFLLQRLFRSQG